ncbi:MAG: polyprenyl synthetase family protein [Elusimicrobia bacterium]|nr:polyprenyl synthetase family protein [Elusimicrobiota bacterium]MDE2237197.1 polyprenyl synthetase family protein [Elusimicrobiota bacterium]MDE2424933.1 polyprenyl synthetase family protein [Elusimicrobiota bacterium]
MPPELKDFMERRSRQVERSLRGLLDGKQRPKRLAEAMSYSLFAGGKRLRPILVMAGAECCGLEGRKALKAACALEMIHTYSLIHDDLPAMDDDDLRRGKPTNHKVFGEALAILAGDGLLTYAFETAAANARDLGLDGRATAELIACIARGAGALGMVGGQACDLEAENWRAKKGRGFNPRRTLEDIHLRKTAALMAASLEAGAILARGSSSQRRRLAEFGRKSGLAFQIADDVLDVVGDKKKLGKSGSDEQNDKLTYARLYGVERARRLADRLAAEAGELLAPFGRKARALRLLADYMIKRDK